MVNQMGDFLLRAGGLAVFVIFILALNLGIYAANEFYFQAPEWFLRVACFGVNIKIGVFVFGEIFSDS